MSKLVRFVVAMIALVFPASHDCFGQPTSPWIGTKVVPKDKAQLRVGDRIVESGDKHRIYTVEKSDGKRLWVVSGNVKGWIQADKVVPFYKAVDFNANDVRTNPGNSAALDQRPLIQFNDKAYDKIIANLKNPLRPNAANSLPLGNRGNNDTRKTEYDKAIAGYDEAIRLNPRDAWAYYKRGLAWHEQEDFEKAIADYNESIRLSPNSVRTYISRGWAWHKRNNFNKAIDDYSEALRLDPMNAIALSNRGYAWHKKKDFEKAITDYNEAVRLNPKLAMAYNNRAWLWATCPDPKYLDGHKAVESGTRACELSEWKYTKYIGTLAAAYAEAGDFENAVEFRVRANEMITDPRGKKTGEQRLALYKDVTPYRDND